MLDTQEEMHLVVWSLEHTCCLCSLLVKIVFSVFCLFLWMVLWLVICPVCVIQMSNQPGTMLLS